ncbi:transketolase family protein [Vibrio coralliilyticus]|uniref:transketolase family protein n=1 Tax=Vibrio coralliilyticus TaxID=190893 RepID=UPI002FD6E0CB
MRAAFITALTELARGDKDIVLVTGDLGFGTFEVFEAEFPNQYFNAGIAEQSMIGIASGLAKAGKKVFVYSIGNFVTLRCLEQIRNDACYHDLNVNLVCQGGGFTYGALGMSHHATEDLAVMRALPNVEVISPSNPEHTKEATKDLAYKKGVSYLRLEKAVEIEVQPTNFVIGRPDYFKTEDADVLIVGVGSIVAEAFDAQRSLLTDEIYTSVLDFHSVSCFDQRYVADILSNYKLVITVEEHQRNGGLGSIISELIVDYSLNIQLEKLAIENKLISEVGSQLYLRKVNGLDAVSIHELVKKKRQCTI